LLTGAGRYEEARDRALAVVREWENVDHPLSATFLYLSYSSLAYIDMYLCTMTHKYDALEYLKKAVEYSKLAPTPMEKMSESFMGADIRSFACLVGQGADSAEFDQFLEVTKQSERLLAEAPHDIYAGYTDLVACEYAFFRNQLDSARIYALNAILKARDNKQYSIVAMAEQYLLRIAMSEGNTSLVKELIKQLRSHLDNSDFWSRKLYHDLYIGAFYAQIGMPKMVPQWLVMDEKEAKSEIRMPMRELIVSTLYYIAAKKYHQALAVMCNPYSREPEERFFLGELRLLLFTAVARIKTDDIEGALVDLERAYELSLNGTFEMLFIELGKELHPLVFEAQKRENFSIPQEWLKAIDRKASIYAKKLAVVANAFKEKTKTQMLAPLSKREREVLLDLYHGLTRDEIAENRNLSINTVKKILPSIYLKLDARNNVDAVRIALEQKLIE